MIARSRPRNQEPGGGLMAPTRTRAGGFLLVSGHTPIYQYPIDRLYVAYVYLGVSGREGNPMDTTAAATQAGVTIDTIRHWCRLGAIAATKAAGRWTISAASLARRIRLSIRRTARSTMTQPWPTDHPNIDLLTEAVDSGVTPQAIADLIGPRTLASGIRPLSRADERRIRTLIDAAQRRTGLLDDLEHLAGCLGHDAAAKRQAADAELSTDALAKMVAQSRDYARAKGIDIRTQAEKDAASAPRPATDRQVDYIADLLNRRARMGDGGGFEGSRLYQDDGRVDMTKIRSLSRQAASEIIASLREDY